MSRFSFPVTTNAAYTEIPIILFKGFSTPDLDNIMIRCINEFGCSCCKLISNPPREIDLRPLNIVRQESYNICEMIDKPLTRELA